MKKVLRFLYFSICAFMLFTTCASAYLDPSTMTYLIQIIAGVLIAAGATAGIVWHKLKRAVKKSKTDKNKPEEQSRVSSEEEKDEDEAD